jgi:hypothetical protein
MYELILSFVRKLVNISLNILSIIFPKILAFFSRGLSIKKIMNFKENLMLIFYKESYLINSETPELKKVGYCVLGFYLKFTETKTRTKEDSRFEK